MRFAYEPKLHEPGSVIGYVAAVINVSDRHRAEEALREANARKDVFLATLAHELRNPLAAMRNAVQLMSVPELGAERSEKAAAIIQRQLKQLARLVDDLLDVSRITRGRLQLAAPGRSSRKSSARPSNRRRWRSGRPRRRCASCCRRNQSCSTPTASGCRRSSRTC